MIIKTKVNKIGKTMADYSPYNFNSFKMSSLPILFREFLIKVMKHDGCHLTSSRRKNSILSWSLRS